MSTLDIERNGRRLQVVAVERRSRLDSIKGDPDLIVGDPGDLADIEWSRYWNPDSL